MCNGCGTHNFARRNACFQCRKSRPDSGGWICRDCNTKNFARRSSCYGCSATRGGIALSLSPSLSLLLSLSLSLSIFLSVPVPLSLQLSLNLSRILFGSLGLSFRISMSEVWTQIRYVIISVNTQVTGPMDLSVAMIELEMVCIF